MKSSITLSSLHCTNLVRAIQSMSSIRVYQSRRTARRNFIQLRKAASETYFSNLTRNALANYIRMRGNRAEDRV